MGGGETTMSRRFLLHQRARVANLVKNEFHCMATNQNQSSGTPAVEEQNLTPDMERMFQESQKAMDGFMDLDENQTPTEPEPSEPETPAEPEPAPEPEPEPQADTTPEVSEPAQPAEEDSTPAPERPVRYIPMDKWKDTKAKWEQREQDLLNQLEEAKQAQPPQATEQDLVKQFAEEHDLNEDQVRGLVNIVNQTSGLSDTDKELLQSLRQQQLDADLDAKDQQYFEQEFNDVALPALKSVYPNATDSQLKAAKDFIDEVSHSEEFHTMKMQHIIQLNTDKIGALFGSDGTPSAPVRTSEAARSTSHRQAPLSVSDIKGIKDFPKIMSLDPAQKQKLISELPPLLYNDYAMWEGQAGQQLEVKRDNRMVRV